VETDPKILAIARAAITQFGLEASAIMRKRADEHALAGEAEGADVWRRIADAVDQLLAEHRSKEP